MPYPDKASLPDWVKKLPDKAQEIFMAAFNAAWETYNGDESKCFAVATAAVKKAGYRLDKTSQEWVMDDFDTSDLSVKRTASEEAEEFIARFIESPIIFREGVRKDENGEEIPVTEIECFVNSDTIDSYRTNLFDAIVNDMDDFMKFACMRQMHAEDACGLWEDWEIRKAPSGRRGLYMYGFVYDKVARDKVNLGIYKGTSVGMYVTQWEKRKDQAGKEYLHAVPGKGNVWEFSLCDMPSNKDSLIVKSNESTRGVMRSIITNTDDIINNSDKNTETVEREVKIVSAENDKDKDKKDEKGGNFVTRALAAIFGKSDAGTVKIPIPVSSDLTECLDGEGDAVETLRVFGTAMSIFHALEDKEITPAEVNRTLRKLVSDMNAKINPVKTDKELSPADGLVIRVTGHSLHIEGDETLAKDFSDKFESFVKEYRTAYDKAKTDAEKTAKKIDPKADEKIETRTEKGAEDEKEPEEDKLSEKELDKLVSRRVQLQIRHSREIEEEEDGEE